MVRVFKDGFYTFYNSKGNQPCIFIRRTDAEATIF